MAGAMFYVIGAVFILFGLVSVLAPRRVVNFNRTAARRHPGPLGAGPVGGPGMVNFQVGMQVAMGVVMVVVGIALIVWHSVH
jgi:hypothetical protein